MSDPYQLLRAAVPVMERLADGGDEVATAWLRGYGELPGAELTSEEVRVLRHAELRDHHPETTERLRGAAYLEGIEVISGPWGDRHKRTMWRRNARGQAALRLRTEPE